ncbi:LLM class flavin-dependent oxidoreductase [Cryptosporangium aurantiacum]|uniref:Flavin-dependent oxidoreductase, luciferase family (Includes alkanesulfonate monooxygenase SsuD and methylene tetrahydromethanopterin reductase) n=1 Tax=Cryptosporangium aurantiacum TaxID=134849 RepID=A0A1M7RP78_9ACTN|nr:LLM class flavin-dependent oxidoreductase [Cryptosporangium aurantiacum]SHN47906.1 Flavin-dependent oxidoreductase, luciferase family (includes alkanesulfonate monooxygenase SsuD and methylene tetrahydromethanopterin reductase) [Cryptosporangium aurantiacum]
MTVRFGVLLNAQRGPAQSESDALARTVNLARRAEDLEVDDLWVVEHHLAADVVSPSSLAMAAFLLGRTRRIRVGTAVTILPLHSPVHVAEQAALLDHLSDGRFSLGVGRGQPGMEYEVIGAGRHYWDRGFPAALDRTIAAFSGDTTAATDLYAFPPAQTVPRPATPGGPPIHVAVNSSASLPTAASRGLPMLMYFDKSTQAKADLVEEHAHIAAANGFPRFGYDHAFSVYAQVTDTPEHARELMLARAESIVARGSVPVDRAPDDRRRGAGSADTGAARAAAIADRLLQWHPVGEPDACAARLFAGIEGSGCTRVLCHVELTRDAQTCLDNLERLATEVFPLVRAELARHAVRSASRLG